MASDPSIRVRMYRVGFGDCFLVSLPSGTGKANVLIDCGVHPAGDIGTLARVATNIQQECTAPGGKPRLDLVIATHAHKDHVSGFSQCKDVFKTFAVGEVWMPWTEDPGDKTATALNQKRMALGDALQAHFSAAAGSIQAEHAVANATANQDAMASLKAGINGGTVRYLKAGESLTDAAGISGLDIDILGPPTDPKFLSIMNPPVGDRFLTLNAAGAAVPANPVVPFSSRWIADTNMKGLNVTPSEKADLSMLLNSAEGLAFTLDSVLNNTSLVSLFKFRGKALLFPGDAQYGNWESWMTTSTGESVLSHLDFLKIAHHGSHNATPKSALERAPDKKFAAMISTQDKPWASIPYDQMLDALNKKAAAVVRSDSIEVSGAKNAPKGPAFVPAPGFTLGDFWCDYSVSV